MSDLYTKQCDSCNWLSHEKDAKFCGNCGKPLSNKDKSTFVLNNSTLLDIHQTSPVDVKDTEQLLQGAAASLQKIEQEEAEHWINLRWFIFASAILSLIFLAVVILVHNQVLVATTIILTAVSLVLASIQSFYFRQWYWFAGILVLGPIMWIIYSLYNPTTKSNTQFPSKQLLLLTLFPGCVLLIVSIVMFSQSSPSLGTAYVIYGCVLLAANIIISITRAIKKQEYEIVGYLIVFNVLAAIFYAVFG